MKAKFGAFLLAVVVPVVVEGSAYPSNFPKTSTNVDDTQRHNESMRRSPRMLLAVAVKTVHKRITTKLESLCKDFEPVLRSRGSQGADIDVPLLLSACQTLEAEMRRMGEKESARDLRNNIRKADNLYQKAPPLVRRRLSTLLAYEKETGVHGTDSRLGETSGAMGFLWIRRSLQFQQRMYSLVLRTNMDPLDASLAAYRAELQPNHSWALRRVYLLALKTTAPSRRELYARLGGFSVEEVGPPEEQAVKRDLKRLVMIWKPLVTRWKLIYEELGLEDKRKV